MVKPSGYVLLFVLNASPPIDMHIFTIITNRFFASGFLNPVLSFRKCWMQINHVVML